MEKKRIEFIDLAKGLCIILVVLGHLVPAFNTNLLFVFCFRMPLYFCLSGLFYKDYGGLGSFTIKKINKILLPFVAWYIIGYCIYSLGRVVTGSQIEAPYHFNDILYTNDIFNLPIWFLLCLFWSNLLFAIVRTFVKKEKQLGIAVLGIAAVGWIMSYNEIFNFLYLGSAMSCLPFFYMGYALKRTALLYPSESVKKEFIIMVACFAGAFLFAFFPEEPPRLIYYTNKVAYGNLAQIYLCALMFVIGILLLCKFIRHIPYVSWLGRYSIIVLVTHLQLSAITGTLLTMTIGSYMSADVRYVINFLVVVACMSLVIPFCKKYLPHITAQKDPIPDNFFSGLKRKLGRVFCIEHK